MMETLIAPYDWAFKFWFALPPFNIFLTGMVGALIAFTLIGSGHSAFEKDKGDAVAGGTIFEVAAVSCGCGAAIALWPVALIILSVVAPFFGAYFIARYRARKRRITREIVHKLAA